MTGTSLLILLAGAAAIVLAVRFYVRGEVRVPGRSVLIGLRTATLLIVILLLLDVRIPSGGAQGPADTGGAWILLDSDLSLLVRSEAGVSLWEQAVERVRAAADEGIGTVLASPGGAGPEGTNPETLRLRGPDHPPGDLVHGVFRLAEAGADSVTILSALRRSSDFLERLRAETPIPVRLERLGGPTRNAGVGELVAPRVAPEGEEVDGQVSIFGEGGEPGDSATVEIARDDEPVRTLRLPLPVPGETATADLVLPPSADTGLVRYTARVRLDGDAFSVDDLRARWVRTGDPEGRIVLISLRPDWEPRFLLPVLRAVTGLVGEGYLAVGEDRFLSLFDGSEAPRSVSAAEVRERASDAALLVLHGADGRVPEWTAAVVREHPRVLHFPRDPEGAALAGMNVAAAAPGPWTPDPEVASSPVAPFLSGLPLGGLPPLSSPLPPEGELDGTVVLRAGGTASEAALPVVLLREEEGGVRRAVALASGFWRWGSRDGSARGAYRSLWGGVSGWLLAPMAPPGEGEVRPVDIVQPRGEPLRWQVPSDIRGAELVLRTASAEPTVYRGLLEPGADGVAATPPMEPGVYRFEVRPPGAEGAAPVSEGWVEVETWAPSLRRPPLDIGDARIPAAVAAARAEVREGRPLRTHPAPYLLGILLLCAEWIWRRRVGLR